MLVHCFENNYFANKLQFLSGIIFKLAKLIIGILASINMNYYTCKIIIKSIISRFINTL